MMWRAVAFLLLCFCLVDISARRRGRAKKANSCSLTATPRMSVVGTTVILDVDIEKGDGVTISYIRWRMIGGRNKNYKAPKGPTYRYMPMEGNGVDEWMVMVKGTCEKNGRIRNKKTKASIEVEPPELIDALQAEELPLIAVNQEAPKRPQGKPLPLPPVEDRLFPVFRDEPAVLPPDLPQLDEP